MAMIRKIDVEDLILWAGIGTLFAGIWLKFGMPTSFIVLGAVFIVLAFLTPRGR